MHPEAPDLDEQVSYTSISIDALGPQSMHEHVQLSGDPDAGFSARAVALSSSRVVGPALMGTTLPALRLVDCHLDRADCANATWVDARMVRCRFQSCKATGLDIRGGSLRDVVFHECKMPDAFMPESTLDRVRFESCQLHALDLSGSKITHVRIADCDARNLRLLDARIEKLDLRGSRIDGIAIDARSIGELIIDPLQAPPLAQAMGARVLDAHDPN
jgi:uncharacterized protein YjbI with pentapeptide repeats